MLGLAESYCLFNIFCYLKYQQATDFITSRQAAGRFNSVLPPKAWKTNFRRNHFKHSPDGAIR